MKYRLLRKTIILFCVSLLGIMGLTGCSSQTAGENAVDEKTTGSSVEDTRTVTTVMGDVEVPLNPQRIIVNWYIGDVFALGLKPVAAFGWSQETMPFYDQFEGVTMLENWEAEDLMTYSPDLIITYSEEDYEKLSKVAPVVVVPESTVTSEERLAFLGEVTGRDEEAKAEIDTFKTKLSDVKEVLKSNTFADKTFSIFQDWGSSSYGLYYETGSRGGTLIYDYLGLNLPDKLKELMEEKGEGRGSLSYEVASEYFGDYVLWFLVEDYESEFAQTDIWKSIPAVKEGRVIEIPSEYMGLFYYSDVLSLTAQLDYIVDKLQNVAE